MSARIAILSVLVASGCMTRSSLVTFPPARKITAIEVETKEVSDSTNAPRTAISDPQKIDEILDFLHRHEGKWDNSKRQRATGRYHVTFVGEGITLFMRTGSGVMQVQGGDYACHYKELTNEEQNTLLMLLKLPPEPPPDESLARDVEPAVTEPPLDLPSFTPGS